ncbi:MAG: hypothetical protein ACPKM1_15705 [Spirochaetaceae bacterium]
MNTAGELKVVAVALGIVIALIQWLHHIWRSGDKKEILSAISQGISSFEPQLRRTERIEQMATDLSVYHEKEMEMRMELARLSHTIATTQKHIARLLERSIDRSEADFERIEDLIVAHQKQCTEQFHLLDKEIGGKQ